MILNRANILSARNGILYIIEYSGVAMSFTEHVIESEQG